jgi:hypothetical protein
VAHRGGTGLHSTLFVNNIRVEPDGAACFILHLTGSLRTLHGGRVQRWYAAEKLFAEICLLRKLLAESLVSSAARYASLEQRVSLSSVVLLWSSVAGDPFVITGLSDTGNFLVLCGSQTTYTSFDNAAILHLTGSLYFQGRRRVQR